MAERRFVHLHCHTHYSLLDGANRIPQLVARVKELGMNAVAMTDHGNLYGAIEFYKECKDAGVNPYPGLDGGFLGSRFSPWRIGKVSTAAMASTPGTRRARSKTSRQAARIPSGCASAPGEK